MVGRQYNLVHSSIHLCFISIICNTEIINLPHWGTGGPSQKVNGQILKKYTRYINKNHTGMKDTGTWSPAQFIYV